MSYACGTQSGLIIPMKCFLPLINEQTVEKFDCAFAAMQNDLQEALSKHDQSSWKDSCWKSRESCDFMANRVIQSFYDHFMKQTTLDKNYVAEIRSSFSHCVNLLFEHVECCDRYRGIREEVADFFDGFFKEVLGASNIPTLKDIKIFDYMRDHGDHWDMGGLMSTLEGPFADLSVEEMEREVHRKPCFIFEESECFRVVPSAKGKRFKELLGVSCFETSRWVWQSY